jgi:hypothetical protein
MVRFNATFEINHTSFTKANEIAESMGSDDFKASWQWLNNFRTQRCLNSMTLQGEADKVDKYDPELLERLTTLCNIVNNYVADNVYNMDETGYFTGWFQGTPF